MNASPLRLPDAGSIEAVDRAGGSPRPQLSRSGCGLIEREKREDKHRDGAADYPQVGPDGTHETPPARLVRLPAARAAVLSGLDGLERSRAPRFCELALDIRDYTNKGGG